MNENLGIMGWILRPNNTASSYIKKETMSCDREKAIISRIKPSTENFAPQIVQVNRNKSFGDFNSMSRSRLVSLL